MNWQHNIREILLLAGGVSLALIIPVAIGAGELTWRMALAIVAISSASIVLGRDVFAILRLPSISGFDTAATLVIGFATLSLLHLTVTVVFSLSALQASGIDLLAITVFHFAPPKWQPAGSAQLNPEGRIVFTPLVIDMLALLLISVLVTLWVREAIVSVRMAEVTGQFRAWLDFFLHAAEVTYLRDYSTLGGHSLYLADAAQPLYHRASYAMASVFSLLGGQPSLATATYFWMPVGIILFGFGVYGFACALDGKLAGYASVLAMFMLPDASMYGLRNGFLGFHWLMQISPGSGYAIAIILIALGVYVRRGEKNWLAPSLTITSLLAMAAAFRMHIAILATFMFALLALLSWRPAQRRHTVMAVVFILAIGIAVVFLFEQIALAPHFLSGKFQAGTFFDTVLSFGPSDWLYKHWTANTGMAWHLAVGYALLLLASLGVIFPLIIAVTILLGRSSHGQPTVHMIPVVLLVVYFALIIVMPTPVHGDVTDFGHRPFLLVYAILLTMLVSWAVIFVREHTLLIKNKNFVCISLLAVAMVGVAGIWQSGINIQQSSLSWGASYAIVPVSTDMINSTQYIRNHALSGDHVLSSDEDPLAIVVALTEKPAYLSRKDLFSMIGGSIGEVFTKNSLMHRQLGNISSYAELVEFGRSNKVDWYLLRLNDMPNWPKALLDRHAFQSGDILAFDLRGGQ